MEVWVASAGFTGIGLGMGRGGLARMTVGPVIAMARVAGWRRGAMRMRARMAIWAAMAAVVAHFFCLGDLGGGGGEETVVK